jgi:hypothetical protein
LVCLLGGGLWAAWEYGRQGNRRGSLLALSGAGVAGIALLGTAYLLMYSYNPWAWIGLPMACRYTLRGC